MIDQSSLRFQQNKNYQNWKKNDFYRLKIYVCIYRHIKNSQNNKLIFYRTKIIIKTFTWQNT